MEVDEIHDAVIVGAGPAGVSCAIWLARLGFTPVLLEAADQVGGLCREHPFSDGWNATLPGMTGPEVAHNLAHSLQQARVDTRLANPVSKIGSSDGVWVVHVHGDGRPLRARHVVLATGVCPRGLPGWPAHEPLPEGVLVGPGAVIVDQDFRNKRVAVLGGGDNAFENALYVVRHDARDVCIYARNIRAQRQFVEQFPSDRVVRGDYTVDVYRREVNGTQWDLILVFYGWEARIPAMPLSCAPRLSPQGFVLTDPATAQTSLSGIYAIGEVAQRMHPCVVTALADGVTAAKAIQARLEQNIRVQDYVRTSVY